MNAMIFAAGMGSRLGTLTADRPKALVEILGKPMLEHQLLHLRALGVRRVVINVHHYASQIVEFIETNSGFGMDVQISNEQGRLLDTGGGLRRALPLFDNDYPILLHNVDIFSSINLASLYSSHLSSKTMATLVVAKRETSRQLFFDGNRLVGWGNSATGEWRSPFGNIDREHLAMYAFQGVHVVSKAIAESLMLEREECFGITDFYIRNADKLQVEPWIDNQPDSWVDAGKPNTLPKAADIIGTFYKG